MGSMQPCHAGGGEVAKTDKCQSEEGAEGRWINELLIGNVR